MRINPTDSNGGYNVANLDGISSGASDIAVKCNSLIECGNDMKSQVETANQDFDTVNYDRVYEHLNSYLQNANDFFEEISELVNSVKEYEDDKLRRWS